MWAGKIQMVDLVSQYHRWQTEIDEAIRAVMEAGSFINGPQVKQFATHLATYLGAGYVIPCGNGTDALQIALMRLELKEGDEVIVPAFTYAAAVEAAVLLGLKPVLADVDAQTFNLLPGAVAEAVTERTKAIIAVHLFGQPCDMHPILEIAAPRRLAVIEDNAQSLGAAYTFPNGETKMAGTMGAIGTLSFFPTKTLGCYGDGGALITNQPELAEAIRKTTIHGQSAKYHHQLIGVNSRLDTLQAAILDVKLRYIGEAIASRQAVAAFYDEALAGTGGIILPHRQPASTHIYNQYTLQITGGKREALQTYLKANGIPTTIYYPLSIDEQEAFKPYVRISGSLANSRQLARQALSLPIHTEMDENELHYITEKIKAFHLSSR